MYWWKMHYICKKHWYTHLYICDYFSNTYTGLCKEKIHINDAKNLFNSLDVLEKIVRANKKLNKAQEKEWKDTFTLSVKLLNVDEYDKKTLLSANKVLESSSNSYNFTLYSILLMSLAFIAQVTFIILTLTGVL